ncbi:hypothetical protein DFA_03682 [Cavenderia fasciculata]|uniref:LNS2/PITP domain-containing protein n=1 Tax=Cavenderia fasciculata TaxID=261658 RepID=F4Q1P5_CACFS|nr:uncharacterized protein DFA_03682 [Cavenderia fasciculata]EGG18195.1 hypothetical protein DFA_03682 [Cavenderia fasciculata]|eukprot:XP_004357018.1 hypothetical protein DFA_03682 [Cavenderia fasciculata]
MQQSFGMIQHPQPLQPSSIVVGAAAAAKPTTTSSPSSSTSGGPTPVVIQPPVVITTTTTTTTTTVNNSNLASGGGVIGISSSSAQGLFTLPEGPVFMSPNRLLTSFNREVIKKNPEEFKIACLQDIQNIFPPGSQPFYAGFGNRSTDATAYNAVGIPNGKIFTINHDGIINTNNNTYNKSYTKLNDLVQDMFPHAKTSVDEQWNEFHYWRKTRVLPISKLEPL